MKIKSITLLAVFLVLSTFLLTGCNTPHTERGQEVEDISSSLASSNVDEIPSASGSSNVDNPPSASDSSETVSKKPFVIQRQDGNWDISGLTAPAPAQQLSEYFKENLSTDQYLRIDCVDDYDLVSKTSSYHVLIWAVDMGPFQNFLDLYDGPWTPILFDEVPYSLDDLMKGETDIKSFLEGHPEIVYMEVTRSEDLITVAGVTEGYEVLCAFANSYHIPELFFIEKYVPEEMLNPD